MADAPIITIRRTFARPDPQHVAMLAAMPTGWVVDAQGRKGALPHWIRPITKTVRASGVALTVWSRPRDNLAPYVALKYARPGDVLVIRTEEYEEASVLGDVLLGMAKNAGVVAVVTDGMVRDVDGLNAVGIPVFARGLSPNSPFKDGPGEIGTSVALGGVIVHSGDVVVLDQDGVVVVPSASLPSLRAALAAIAEKEDKMDAQVRAGAARPDWVDALVESPKVGFLD